MTKDGLNLIYHINIAVILIMVCVVVAGCTSPGSPTSATSGSTPVASLTPVPMFSGLALNTSPQSVDTGKNGNSTTDLIDQILAGNQKFQVTGYNMEIMRYQTLAASQNPGILWIGCSDSRADPERITNALPGELFVTRNVGNIVPVHDWGMASVVEYSINYLNVREIVVVGHSDCGAMKALDKELQDPYIPVWLNDAREAKTRVDARFPKPTTPAESRERMYQIEQENVRLQIEHLMTYPTVADAVAQGKVRVNGLYYNLTDGTLSVIQ